MIVWLLVVIIHGDMVAPLGVFPHTTEGSQSCWEAVKEAREAIRQDFEVKCARYTIAPYTGTPGL